MDNSGIIYGSAEWYTELFWSTGLRETALFYYELSKNSFNILNHDQPGFPFRRSIKYCNEQIIYLSFTVFMDQGLTTHERLIISKLIGHAEIELDLLCGIGRETKEVHSYPAFISGWKDFAIRIPEFKRDLFKNQMHIQTLPRDND